MFEENLNVTVSGPLLVTLGDKCFLKTSAIVLVFVAGRIWDRGILPDDVRDETVTLTLQHSIQHLS